MSNLQKYIDRLSGSIFEHNLTYLTCVWFLAFDVKWYLQFSTQLVETKLGSEMMECNKSINLIENLCILFNAMIHELYLRTWKRMVYVHIK